MRCAVWRNICEVGIDIGTERFNTYKYIKTGLYLEDFPKYRIDLHILLSVNLMNAYSCLIKKDIIRYFKILIGIM